MPSSPVKHIQFCWHKHGWKMFWRLVKNIQLFQMHSCWNTVLYTGVCLVSFRDKNHWAGVGKRSHFGHKHSLKYPNTSLKKTQTTWPLVKNIPKFPSISLKISSVFMLTNVVKPSRITALLSFRHHPTSIPEMNSCSYTCNVIVIWYILWKCQYGRYHIYQSEHICGLQKDKTAAFLSWRLDKVHSADFLQSARPTKSKPSLT